MSEQKDLERAAFEAWMHTYDSPPALEGEIFNDERYPNADCFGKFVYDDLATQRCWSAWQARASLPAAGSAVEDVEVAGINHGVILPERKSVLYGFDGQRTYALGWNACLSEVSSLNQHNRIVAALSAQQSAQDVSVPECVRNWFDAKLAHVEAVDAYNMRRAFIREHMPFGASPDPEYQIMEAADRKARELNQAMFVELRALLNGGEA